MQREELERTLSELPKTIELGGGESVELRLMTADDIAAVQQFARSLSEEDLLFLRMDITQESAVRDWVGRIESGYATTILAVHDGAVVGYVTVERNPARWTRRVGEIRVNVGPTLRGKGLGRHLTSRIFNVAFGLGLKKLMAQMTPDQLGAQAAFTRLGFMPEAVLSDYVEDRNGMAHDLVIMSYDIDGLTSRTNRPLRI